MSNEIQSGQDQGSPMMIESLSIEQAQKTFTNLQAFIKTQMRQGTDYGIIPGCKKPSLYKPGAEKLVFFHGLGVKLEPTSETIVDWKSSPQFFNFAYRATVYNPRTMAVIATADGSCNSKEEKYAYRWVPEKQVPRGTNKEELQSKSMKGKYGAFVVYRLDNTEIAGLNNTICKMAQKRAFVAAALIACRASDIFTQDVEEEEGEGQEPQGDSKASPGPSLSEIEAISEPQRKRLFVLSKQYKVSEESLKAYLKEFFPYVVDDDEVPHTSKIKRSDYEKVCNWVEGKNA